MDLSSHIHGMVVHFPIALLFASVALEIAALFYKAKREQLQFGGLATLVLGTIGAAAAVFTGPDEMLRASPLGHTHENWAHITLILFGLLTVWRLGMAVFKKNFNAVGLTAYMLVAVLGLGALGYTGYLGGTMVYENAVGVRHNGQLVVPPPAGHFRGGQ